MKLAADCKTTAMGILPHTDIDAALDLALSLDVPFWPQLPRVSFFEDMYAQVSEGFPGVAIDTQQERVTFARPAFERDLEDYSSRMGHPETFELSSAYSLVFHRFLDRELSHYPAIRGQSTGPVSFGFRIVDQGRRPIIYDDEVRALLFDFIQHKANVQYQQLARKNQNAFVWLDEPGLGWVFSSLSGYNDVQAREDYQQFLAGMEGPKALHLCANVNLPYLLELGLDIVSFDAYQLEAMPKGYAHAVGKFVASGGIISWGIVPTETSSLSRETPDTLARRLLGYWDTVSDIAGIPRKQIARQALLAPARCCLKNAGLVGGADDPAGDSGAGRRAGNTEIEIVHTAFDFLPAMSRILREQCQL